jgi:hypothetical protein
MADVERGEVLREALAEPLIVVGVPAHRLAPPLMGDFVGRKKVGMPIERSRVVAPRARLTDRWLAEDREVPRAVAAGLGPFDQRERQARVGGIARNRAVEPHDIFRARRQIASLEARPACTRIDKLSRCAAATAQSIHRLSALKPCGLAGTR